jgi:hypothetical protein
MGIKNRETFKHNYNFELANNRNPCGPGSETEKVIQAGTINFIDNIIKKYNINTINDCACGVFAHWACCLDLVNVKYVGYDINILPIERNRKEFPQHEFYELDIVNEDVPYADLVICRDILFHLPNDFVKSIINNIRKNTTKYFLATNHRWLQTNKELSQKELENEVGFRFINLSIEPYNLNIPIEEHNEEVWRYYEGGNNRQISLWKLS